MKQEESLKSKKQGIIAIAGDIMGFAGVGLVSYGAYTIHPAAGFIVLGGCLMAIAFKLQG